MSYSSQNAHSGKPKCEKNCTYIQCRCYRNITLIITRKLTKFPLFEKKHIFADTIYFLTRKVSIFMRKVFHRYLYVFFIGNPENQVFESEVNRKISLKMSLIPQKQDDEQDKL